MAMIDILMGLLATWPIGQWLSQVEWAAICLALRVYVFVLTEHGHDVALCSLECASA